METSNDRSNMNTGTEGHSVSTEKIVTLVVIVVVVLVGYFLVRSGGSEVGERGVVTHTDMKEPNGRTPSGFPLDIPIEAQGVEESFKIEFPEEGLTQYTVSFDSALGGDELWEVYSRVFLTLGYAPDPEETNEEAGLIKGYRDGNTLSIAISSQGEGSQVTIDFLETVSSN